MTQDQKDSEIKIVYQPSQDEADRLAKLIELLICITNKTK